MQRSMKDMNETTRKKSASTGNKNILKKQPCQKTIFELLSLLNTSTGFYEYFDEMAALLSRNDVLGEGTGILINIETIAGNRHVHKNISDKTRAELVAAFRDGVSYENALLIPLNINNDSAFIAILPADKDRKFTKDEELVLRSAAEITAGRIDRCRKDISIAAAHESTASVAQLETFFTSFKDLPFELCSRTLLDETVKVAKCDAAYACTADNEGRIISESMSASDKQTGEQLREEARRILPLIKSSAGPYTGELSCSLSDRPEHSADKTNRYTAVPVIYAGHVNGLLIATNSDLSYSLELPNILSRMARLYSTLTAIKKDSSRMAMKQAEHSSILEGSWDMIFVLNEKGDITYISPSVQKLGYKVSEVEGHNFREFVPEEDLEQLTSKLNITFKTGRLSPTNICRIISKDGRELLTQLRMSVNKVEGMPLSISAIIRDITSDIEKQKQLHEKNLFYKTIFSKSPQSIFIANPETLTILRANNNAAKFFGIPLSELAGHDIIPLFPEEDRQGISELLEKNKIRAKASSKAGFSLKKRTRLLGAGDVITDVNLTLTYLNIQHGDMVLLVIIENLSAEKKYLEDTAFRIALLNNSPDFLFAVDLDSASIVFANKAMCALTGISEKDISAGAPFEKLYSSKQAARRRLEELRVRQKTHTIQTIMGTGGTALQVESFSSKTRFNDRPVVIVASRDIGEKLALEKELHKTNETLSSLLASLPDQVQILNAENIVTYDNRNRKTRHNGTAEKESYIFKHNISYMHGKYLEQAIKTGAPVTFMEDVTGEDGRQLYLERRIVPIHDADGNISGTGIITRDYTSKKQDIEKITSMEFILKHIFETSQDFIYVIDSEGRFLMINQAAAAYYGKTVAEMKNKTWKELGLTKQATPRKVIHKIFETKKKAFFTREYVFRGIKHYESLSCSPVLSADGNVTSVVVAGRDLTKAHTEATDKAINAAKEIVSMKMRPIGHDFNNILTVINGYATLLSETSKDDTRVIAGLRQIIKAVDRATRLTERFQTFARNPVLTDNTGNFPFQKQEEPVTGLQPEQIKENSQK